MVSGILFDDGAPILSVILFLLILDGCTAAKEQQPLPISAVVPVLAGQSTTKTVRELGPTV